MSEDAADYTGRYNTPLPTDQRPAFNAWLSKLSKARGYNAREDLRDYDMPGAFMAGVEPADNGHFTDRFKKPNHPTFSDQSKYHGVDGYQGGTWNGDDDSGYTYAPSPTNLKFYPPDALTDYFKRVEPTNKLVLPTNAQLLLKVWGNQRV